MLNRGRMQQSDGTEEMVDEYLANKRPLLLGMWRQKRIRKNCDSIVMKFTQRRIDSEQQNSHEHKHYRHFYYFIITIKNTNIWIQTQVDCCLCILQMMLYCILIHPLCSLSIVIYEAVDWLFVYLLSNICSLQQVRDNLSVVDKSIWKMKNNNWNWSNITMNKMKPCQSTDCPYEQQLSDISVLWWGHVHRVLIIITGKSVHPPFPLS